MPLPPFSSPLPKDGPLLPLPLKMELVKSCTEDQLWFQESLKNCPRSPVDELLGLLGLTPSDLVLGNGLVERLVAGLRADRRPEACFGGPSPSVLINRLLRGRIGPLWESVPAAEMWEDDRARLLFLTRSVMVTTGAARHVRIHSLELRRVWKWIGHETVSRVR
jgi:hypothetical protein